MDYQSLNIRKIKKNNFLLICNYILFVGFLVSMYIGYTSMLLTMRNMSNNMDAMTKTMGFMLKNTYAMCNMTHVLTTAPAQCVLN